MPVRMDVGICQQYVPLRLDADGSSTANLTGGADSNNVGPAREQKNTLGSKVVNCLTSERFAWFCCWYQLCFGQTETRVGDRGHISMPHDGTCEDVLECFGIGMGDSPGS
jgi:hypothetical protein